MMHTRNKVFRSNRRSTRRLSVENLENRILLVSDWTNQFNALDVDDDEFVAPIDALYGINELNDPQYSLPGGKLPARSDHPTEKLVDVDGDGFLAPLDILYVIVNINGGVTPPVIEVDLSNDTARDGATNHDRITADASSGGTVTDPVDAVTRVTAQIDGGARTDLSLIQDAFSFDPGFTQDGADDGDRTLRITAFRGDVIVNALELPFTFDTQPPAAPALDLAPESDTGTQGDQTTETELVDLAGNAELAARILDLHTGLAAVAAPSGSFQLNGVVLPLGKHTLDLETTDVAGNARVSTATFTRTADPSAIVLNEGNDFVAEASTLVELGLTGSSRTLSFQLEADFDTSDASAVTFALTSDEPLPSITLTGSELVVAPRPGDVGNYSLTMFARDGAAEATQEVTLDAVADLVTTTRISGRILNTDEVPLEGIPIELGNIVTTTAADGSFTIDAGDDPLPADALIIRGEAFAGPEVYPFIAEKLKLLFGFDPLEDIDNVLDRPIYLPVLDTANAVTINPAVDTTVDTAAISGAELFVTAGSLEDQQGNPFTGELGITEVPIDRTPAALPEGINPEIVVTIQPGEMVFTEPAPLALPNTIYAPGEIVDLYSINPVTGDFDIVGQLQISSDGSVAQTITGGVRNSSWHFAFRFNRIGVLSNPNNNKYNQDLRCDECQESEQATSEVQLHSGALIETHDLVTYQSQGTARGVTLTYDSLRADPRPIFHFDFATDTRRIAGDQIPQLRVWSRVGVFDAPEALREQELELAQGLGGAIRARNVPGIHSEMFDFRGADVQDMHAWRLPPGGGRLNAALQGNDFDTEPSGVYFAQIEAGIMLLGGAAGGPQIVSGRTTTQELNRKPCFADMVTRFMEWTGTPIAEMS